MRERYMRGKATFPFYIDGNYFVLAPVSPNPQVKYT